MVKKGVGDQELRMIVHILVLCKLFWARFWGFSILEETLFYFLFSKSVPRDLFNMWGSRVDSFILKKK